jgi:hypothetical protein
MWPYERLELAAFVVCVALLLIANWWETHER